MKAPVRFYLSKDLSQPAEDAKRLQRFIDQVCSGLSNNLTLSENLQTQLLSVDFTTPQSTDLTITTKFATKPLWVELVSFSRTRPTYQPQSLGASFRWTWGNGAVTTDVFNGMPSDGYTYNVQLLAFLQ